MPNQEVMQEWVRRLRSGDYGQGRGRLRRGDRFCCLGVLCEIAFERGVVDRGMCNEPLSYLLDNGTVGVQGTGAYTYNGASTMPGGEVYAWAGIPEGHTNNVGAAEPVTAYSLAHRNDAGLPFDRIADVIESEWIDLPEGVEVPDTPAEITEEETINA